MSKPTHIWTYRNPAGEPIGEVRRFDNPDGKQIIPNFKRNGNGRFAPGAPPEPRPVFGLEQIDTKCVFIVEGEKCAAALQSLGLSTVTSLGGALAAHKSDWTSLQHVERIVLLPDNDAPGEEYAQDVARLLAALPGKRTVELCRLDDFPDGGDVCDWLAAQPELVGWNQFDEIPQEHRAALREGLLRTVKEITEPVTLAAMESAGDWPDIEEPQSPNDEPIPWRDDLLPEPLAGIVSALAESLEVPGALVAAPALAATSTALRGRFNVQARPDWIEPCHLWVMGIAPSGGLKSAVYKACLEPIHTWQREIALDMKAEIKRSQNAHRRWEKKRENLERKLSGEGTPDKSKTIEAEILELENDEPKILHAPRLTVQSISPEEMGILLELHNEALGVLSPEPGATLLEALGLYSGKPNIELMLKAYDGEFSEDDRVTRVGVTLQSPRLSIGIMSQPGFAEKIMNNPMLFDRGLVHRWIYLYPEESLSPRTFQAPSVSSEAMEAYREMMLNMLAWEVTEPGALKLTLSDEALNVLLDYAKELDAERINLFSGGNSHFTKNMLPWMEKHRGRAVRIAGMFHLIEHHNEPSPKPWYFPIEGDTMRRAVEFCRYLEGHAIKVYPGDSCVTLPAQKILGWIKRKRKDSFTTSEVCQCVRFNPKMTAQDAKDILEDLENQGYIRGNLSSTHWEVNPVIHGSKGQEAA